MSSSNHPPGKMQHDAAAYVDLNGNAARAIAAATAQIDLALREAQVPVESLGNTLERISVHMQELRGKFLTHTRNCGGSFIGRNRCTGRQRRQRPASRGSTSEHRRVLDCAHRTRTRGQSLRARRVARPAR